MKILQFIVHHITIWHNHIVWPKTVGYVNVVFKAIVTNNYQILRKMSIIEKSYSIETLKTQVKRKKCIYFIYFLQIWYEMFLFLADFRDHASNKEQFFFSKVNVIRHYLLGNISNFIFKANKMSLELFIQLNMTIDVKSNLMRTWSSKWILVVFFFFRNNYYLLTLYFY